MPSSAHCLHSFLCLFDNVTSCSILFRCLPDGVAVMRHQVAALPRGSTHDAAVPHLAFRSSSERSQGVHLESPSVDMLMPCIGAVQADGHVQ